jgi:siderophore synthetase component
MFESCDQNTQEREILDQCLLRADGVNEWLQELKEQDDSNRAKDKRNLMDEVLVSQGFNHQTLGENNY